MEHRSQLVFLFLILSQAAHSIEEYVTSLYDVFAPARFVSSLVSNNLGRSRTLRLACSSRVNLVLDASGTGQRHRPLSPCFVARGLLPRGSDGSSPSVLRWVAGGSSGASGRPNGLLNVRPLGK